MAILSTQLARVSNQLRTSVSQSAISRTQRSLLEVQNELITGKRINAPSDDPGDAAIVQQLRKTLEQRAAYLGNVKQAGSHLGEVDATLGDLTDLLQQAQDIASANVGSDVTAEQRKSAAAVVDNIYSQVLSLANKQFEGMYLFAGDRLTDPPFVSEGGGVKFVGSTNTLSNACDENSVRPFMVNGERVFGALSTRVEGTANITPSVSAATRLVDLAGVSGNGIRLGAMNLSNGGASALVDLSQADTVGDVMDAINAAGVGGITASLSARGLVLTGGGGDDITVTDVGGGTTASDLGILRAVGAGAGLPLNGADTQPKVTNFTPLAALNSGAGIDLTSGITIQNGQQSATIDFAGATTVQDMLNRINNYGTHVRAEINASGTGINLLNPTQGTNLSIAENGGTTAADLGVRSFGPASALSELNLGKGVRMADGADLTITRSDGTSFQIDVNGAITVQDVIDAINTADAGGGVTASFSTTGNGIVLTDTSGGAGTLVVAPANYSEAAKDLGLLKPSVGAVLAGDDVNPVKAGGVFSNLSTLLAALHGSDQQAITDAAAGLKANLTNLTTVRGETGARVQELESRQNRLEDENLATQSLLSNLQEVDMTEAISRFQTLQTALQASMMTTSRIMNLSLLDFLS
ncbi:MAG TPA: flagellin hook IN motif-containing protein [Tepidisphaeraceae bacterium]|nr:flagellin hook IN motif-containing protein [Tepidisphaeraceae bacterium]